MEYRYLTKHGLGPGTIPKDVKLLKWEDLPNYLTAIYLDRPLTTKELKEYDIYPEYIQENIQNKKYDIFESINDTDIEILSQLNLSEADLSIILSLMELITSDEESKNKALELITLLFKDKELIPVSKVENSESMNYTIKLLGKI